MTSNQTRIPATGFLRLPQVLSLFPIGRSTWWRGVKEGRYPKPVKISVRTSAWRTQDILDLLEKLGGTVESQSKDGGRP
jgi:predicted DNA-binding transcriptional regulator AlpA